MEIKNILGHDPFQKEDESSSPRDPAKNPSLKLLNTFSQTGIPSPRSPSEPPTLEELRRVSPPAAPTIPHPPSPDLSRFTRLDRIVDIRLREIEDQIVSSFQLLEKGMEEIMQYLTAPGLDTHQIEEGIRRVVDTYGRRFDSVIESINTSLPRPKPRKSLLNRVASPIFKGQQLLRPVLYRNLLRRFSMRGTGEEVDEFGYDSVYEDRMKFLFDFLYRKWWRIEAEGVSNIPDAGRALLVSNHSGAIPFDALMIKLAVRYTHPLRREVRPLVENFSYFFPYIGNFLARTGSVRACQENAQRLLEHDEAIVVFPEGNKGPTKLFRERYRLQRFGRGGFVRLAIKSRTPIVPIAVVGAEEIYPVFARADFIGKRIGLPIFFITPTFPWLGPFGAIPLPSKWFIKFGEAIRCDEYPPEASEDEILVNQLSEKIRGVIQEMVYEVLKKRKSVWKG